MVISMWSLFNSKGILGLNFYHLLISIQEINNPLITRMISLLHNINKTNLEIPDYCQSSTTMLYFS